MRVIMLASYKYNTTLFTNIIDLLKFGKSMNLQIGRIP